MDRQFALQMCEIGLFDAKIEEYYLNIKLIKNALQLIDKVQSTRAHQYLDFIYNLANRFVMPISEPNLEVAI